MLPKISPNWSDPKTATPLQDLRRLQQQASEYARSTTGPCLFLFDPIALEMLAVTITEWDSFLNHVAKAEMLEGISRRGLFVRWHRWKGHAAHS